MNTSLAHAGATAYCNGEDYRPYGLDSVRYNFRSDENAWDNFTSGVANRIQILFGHVPAGFFVNGDARGSALKLDCDFNTLPDGAWTDWGGDMILAAVIND